VARRVAWTETAWRDLERVAEYIGEDSPGYAAGIVRRIRDQARSLGELTEMGRVVPELDDPKIRELVVGSYRLIYEANEESVYILALIHGARDLAALWRREGRT
jgi:toxin ParE1/3/4